MGFAPKRELDAVDAVEISPKRHQPELDDNSTEGILSRITLPNLKSCFRDLLTDPLCGPFIEAHLHTYADKSWDAERERAEQQAKQIRTQASRAVGKVDRRAYSKDFITEAKDWGNAIAPFLKPVYSIWQLGPRRNGPKLAFDMLMDFAKMIIVPQDEEMNMYGNSDENDYLHRDIESILVAILREDCGGYGDAADWTTLEQTVDRRNAVEKLNKAIADSEGPYQYRVLSELLLNGKIQGYVPPINVGHLGQRSIWMGGHIIGYHNMPPAMGSDSEEDNF